MSRRAASYQHWRPLITETLPYEVPVVFSNDLLFASLSDGASDPSVTEKLVDIRRPRTAGTKPYAYQIVKDRFQHTTLGLVHPISQIRMAEFYDSYSASITAACNESSFSIRRPAESAPLFVENDLSPEKTEKQGIPHVEPDEGDLDVSQITSFFAYKGYNLLSRFIDSPEFIRLEKRFSRLRSLDVSRCLFHIYTHTISWAIKGKDTAKREWLQHSFDGAFDALMQDANYKETNGIVVGPEISRIFAEIILQAVDREVEQALTPMEHNRDYAVRRYVDDFYVFASTDQDLDLIQSAIEHTLESYKLFLNAEKVETLARPFVSKITLARRDARRTIQHLFAECAELMSITDPRALRLKSRSIVGTVADLRMVVGNYGVGFHTLSGWLLGSIRVLLGNVTALSNGPTTGEQLEGLADIEIALLELVSYIVALDLRVRTSYTFCQIALQAARFATQSTTDHRDRILHTLHQETVILVRAAHSSFLAGGRRDSVELYNLLITAVHVVGPMVMRDSVIKAALETVSNQPYLSYFQFITVKFCLIQDQGLMDARTIALNAKAKSMLIAQSADDLSHDSELYHLFCDFMSAPDVSTADKREVLKKTFGGDLSNDQISSLGSHLGFTDWHGLRVGHLLDRKQLRPVYSMS